MRQRYDISSRGIKPNQSATTSGRSGHTWSVKDLATLSPALAELPGNKRTAVAIRVLAGAGITGRNSQGKLDVPDPTDPDEVEAALTASTSADVS